MSARVEQGAVEQGAVEQGSGEQGSGEQGPGDQIPFGQAAAAEPARDPQPRRSRVFRPSRTAMPRDAAARQLRLISLAWAALRTPDRVKAFLNEDHSALSARPLDVAIASDAGLARVAGLLSGVAHADAAAA